jgi:hypothetical protein
VSAWTFAGFAVAVGLPLVVLIAAVLWPNDDGDGGE